MFSTDPAIGRVATDSSPDRDQQFRYISSLRTRFERQGLPIISVDTKKRELVGNFNNHGVKWASPSLMVTMICSSTESIAGWWKRPAQSATIAAATRARKTELQTQLCNRFGLTVTVAHYPTGASKWNPIEHRLFSEISKNWAAEPPDSYPKILNFIRHTCTRTGLTVSAYLDRRHYPTGTPPDPAQVRRLCRERHSTLPAWNYTIAPV